MAFGVAMTGMPQMVGLLNSFGGLASALVAIGLFYHNGAESHLREDGEVNLQRIELVISVFIGVSCFTGSLLACAKLYEWVKSPLIPFRHMLNLLLLGGVVVLATLTCYNYDPEDRGDSELALYGMVIVSGLLGITLVVGIGGADMPVVISFLNSLSGWAGSAAGFTINNTLLIVTGSFVGASGAILSYIMCRGMGRSFMNVLAGGFGGTTTKKSGDGEKKTANSASPQEMAAELLEANSICIVPGYGMAVSQAQHAVAEITKLLISMGKKVEFGIHPVAGRLPGHMNVLLAEARVPYEIVKSMDEVNPSMPETDAVIIIGANDTVNPVAQSPEPSNLQGMPVIEVWKAKRAFVIKRSLAPGYAGVENDMFYYDHTRMVFGDGKANTEKLMDALKVSARAEASAMGKSDTVVVDIQSSAAELEALPTFKRIGIVKEVTPRERRVAITPGLVKRFRKQGFEVLVESGAGVGCKFSDETYKLEGATIVPSAREVWGQADVVAKIAPPTEHPELGIHEADMMRDGKIVISFVQPAKNKELLERMASTGATVLAMDQVPRISRAQKLDALSSSAKLAGYRAVVEAANVFERFFVGEITAAGKFPPAKILVIGAGVAGLQAIGTGKALGAIVRAFDTRPSVKDQVKSLGGEFIEVDLPQEDSETAGGYAKTMSPEFIAAEMELFARQAKEVDIIVTTAAIPNKRAPVLITKEMVDTMKEGSVVVDLAAETGGNCELTKLGEAVLYKGVTIIGYNDLNARMGSQSSAMYATNIANLMEEMGKAKDLMVDFDNQVIRNMTVCRDKEITWPAPQISVTTTQAAAGPGGNKVAPAGMEKKATPKEVWTKRLMWMLPSIIGVALIAIFAPDSFAPAVVVFILACVIGYCVIWDVAPALHTPLMSVTNAISGVVIIGAISQVSSGESNSATEILSAAAICVAAINVVGGFAVTQRMLMMFRGMNEAMDEDSDKPGKGRK
eukprot:TRINITY_DN460_c0_g1_i2.p1 TRINITY_DN460_c0_g1~~TRINITY_DN460_c0_g1_i2.p1  ORF type:complete len:1087 (-),score=264.33 TRINITY_DN460_c0_g1_i2:222-3125(-)